MKAPGVPANLDEVVIGFRRDQQGHRDNQQQQRDAIVIARVKPQALEPVSEYATELETQQNMGAENEHPSFVEGSLDEYGKSDLAPTISARRNVYARLTSAERGNSREEAPPRY